MNDDKLAASCRRLLVIDSRVAGVSGDMMLGALVDLGASPTRITKALQTAVGFLDGCRDLRVEAKSVSRRGIQARKVDVLFEDEASARTGGEIKAAIVSAAGEIGLSAAAREFAAAVVETLTDAERTVHGKSLHHDVHFHEIGSADTVADILGVAVALDELGLFTDTVIYATPVAVGEGSLKISHGTVAVPAPATLEILRAKNIPLLGGAAAGELATPTGVSLVANLAHKVTGSYPAMRPIAIGYGAGTKDFSEMANVVRLTLGEPLAPRWGTDEIYVLETNLDDLSGEVVGYATDRLLKEGARDCCVIPIYTKKNRPGQILQVITDETKIERLVEVLIEETGTLGVRCFPCERFVLARESRPVTVQIGAISQEVRVKVSRDSRDRVLQVKPEYDDVRRLAEASGRPLREVLRLVQTGAWREVDGENRQDT